MPRQTPKTPFAAIFFAAMLLACALLALFNSPLANRSLVRGAQSVTVHTPPLLYNYEETLTAVPTPYVERGATLPPLHVPRPPAPRHPTISGSGKIAIIIDDVGISKQQTQPLFSLPKRLTLAFLPYGHATPVLAKQAQQDGYEVMLHMPMQPQGQDNPGPDAIVKGLSDEDVGKRLTAALAAVPEAIGVNNHMGSAATTDAPLMQAFMATLAPTGKFFIDSYTAAQSVAYGTAQQAGIKALRRDVFLDNEQSQAATARQLAQLEDIARRHGYAIGIGHPYPSTIAALQAWLPVLDSRGITLVTVSDLMKEIHGDD